MAEQTIEERVGITETKVDGLGDLVCELRTDIKEIKDKLLARPSWTVSLIITFLVGTVIALISLRIHG